MVGSVSFSDPPIPGRLEKPGQPASSLAEGAVGQVSKEQKQGLYGEWPGARTEGPGTGSTTSPKVKTCKGVGPSMPGKAGTQTLKTGCLGLNSRSATTGSAWLAYSYSSFKTQLK